jgi:hypothetical protein
VRDHDVRLGDDPLDVDAQAGELRRRSSDELDERLGAVRSLWVVLDVTLDFETLQLPGDPGQALLTYSAEPGSPSDQALQLLASWASTPVDEGHRADG